MIIHCKRCGKSFQGAESSPRECHMCLTGSYIRQEEKSRFWLPFFFGVALLIACTAGILSVYPRMVFGSDTQRESFEVHNDDLSITGNTWLAQSFTASADYNITSVSLQVIIYNAGNWTVRIQSDNGSDTPSGTDLTSKTQSLSTTGWNEFVFDSPYTLVSGTKYWIVASSVNLNTWYANTTGGYTGGHQNRSTNAGASWDGGYNSGAYDMNFRTFGTDAVVAAPVGDEFFIFN